MTVHSVSSASRTDAGKELRCAAEDRGTQRGDVPTAERGARILLERPTVEDQRSQ